MNYSNHYFSLDIHEVVSQVSLSVKRGDTSRKLNIVLTENGYPYEIGADCAVVFSGKKADGTILYNECLVKNNVIEYALTPQTTSAVGIVECEILVYGLNSQVLYNPCFSIVVYSPSFNSDDVESTDEFSALTQAMGTLGTLIDQAEDIIGSAESDVNEKIATAKRELIGTVDDEAGANTVYGAKVYAKDSSQKVLAEVKTELANDRNSISRDIDITHRASTKGFITTGVPIGSLISFDIKPNNGRNHVIVPVIRGDRFKISGYGAGTDRLWAFVDKNNILLEVSDSSASGDFDKAAPQDGYLICNFMNSYPYSLIYTGFGSFAKVIESEIDKNAEELSVLSDELNVSNYLTLGGYIANEIKVGNVVNLTVTSNGSWLYAVLPVKAGETYKVIGKGGYASRLWLLTDLDYVTLSFSDKDFIGEDFAAVSEDGYLLVNTQLVKDIGIYLVNTRGFKETVKKSNKLTAKQFSWTDKPSEPYWILALDCGKKYFSVDNVKIMIDRAYAAGFNQFQMQLTTNMGFRFGLDDMNFKDINGNTYDLSACLGGTENPTGWYTMEDMDEIISYCKSKGLDFYPFMPMPTHMRRLLSYFPQFQEPTADSIINVADENAVNFAIAIADKYAKYFASRGCHFYNFGFDEANFNKFYTENRFDEYVDFGNLLIDTIKRNGLQARMYNDGVYYNNDYKYQFDKEVEVLCWRSTTDQYAPNLASFNAIQKAGYKIINSASWLYYIDGQTHIPIATLETLDILKYYAGFTKYFDNLPSGAALSIWCDNSVTTNPGDNGNAVVADTADIIEAFGSAIKMSLKLNGF